MPVQAMDPTRRRSPSSLRAVWLLWLALLLPLAQSVASAHAHAHAHAHERAGTSARGDADPADLAEHAAPCDLCLLAAALASGPLLSAGAPAWLQPGFEPAPQSAATGVWPGQAVLGYQSRAPPVSAL